MTSALCAMICAPAESPARKMRSGSMRKRSALATMYARLVRLPDGRRELRFGRNRIVDADCHEATRGEDLQIVGQIRACAGDEAAAMHPNDGGKRPPAHSQGRTHRKERRDLQKRN